MQSLVKIWAVLHYIIYAVERNMRQTISPSLDASELLEKLCLCGTLQLLDQASAVRGNLNIDLVINS